MSVISLGLGADPIIIVRHISQRDLGLPRRQHDALDHHEHCKILFFVFFSTVCSHHDDCTLCLRSALVLVLVLVVPYKLLEQYHSLAIANAALT